MSTEERFWQFVIVLVGLLTVTAPAYVAYDLNQRGPASVKRVELREHSPIDLKGDLSLLGNQATLSIKIKNETLDNLVLKKTWFTNAGKSPILPEDFHENLRVETSKPWRIVAIENGNDFTEEVKLTWTKISDFRFEAKPTLLNPGDMASVVVYLTNTQSGGVRSDSKPESLKLNWRARVTNLNELTKVPASVGDSFNQWGFVVHLSGWGLVFTIFAALLFQALYLRLLSQAGYLRTTFSSSIILVVLGTSLLSFAAAECVSYYIFPNYLSLLFGAKNYLMNGVIILGHVTLVIVLYSKVRAFSRKQSLAESA